MTKQNKSAKKAKNNGKNRSDKSNRSFSSKPGYKSKMTYRKQKRIDTYNEFHSKVVLQNMFYKDKAPGVITLIYKGDIEKYTQWINSVQDTENNLYAFSGTQLSESSFSIKVQSKNFLLNLIPYSDIDGIIDSVKVSDLVVFDVAGGNDGTDEISYDSRLDLEILETLSIINAHGQIKTSFISLETIPGHIKSQYEKRLSSELGSNIKIQNTNQFRLFLSKFKIRPVEFKCNNTFIMIENVEIRDGEYKLQGHLRGKPANISASVNLLSVSEQRFLNIISIEKIRDGIEFRDVKNEEEVEEESEIEIIEDRGLSDVQEESFESDGEEIADLNNEESESEPDRVIEDKNKVEISENFLMKKKKQQINEFNIKNDILRSKGYLIPGDFVEIRVKRDSVEISDHMIIAVIEKKQEVKKPDTPDNKEDTSPTDGDFLVGDLVVNKFYRSNIPKLNDIFSRDSPMMSIGWFRMGYKGNCMLSRNDTLVRDITKNDTRINISQKDNTDYLLTFVEMDDHFFLYNPNLMDNSFRIFASGKFSTTSLLYKSITLSGYPKNIQSKSTHINNIIVTGMFTSKKESSKFIYAKVESTTGIRGIIKSSVGRGGDVRVTFEGNILKSDIVVLKMRERVRNIIEESESTVEENNSIAEERFFVQESNVEESNTGDEVEEHSDEFEEEEYSPKGVVQSGYIRKLQRQWDKLQKPEENKLDEIEKFLNGEESTEVEEESEIEDTPYIPAKMSENRRINAIQHIKQNKKKHRVKKNRGKGIKKR